MEKAHKEIMKTHKQMLVEHKELIAQQLAELDNSIPSVYNQRRGHMSPRRNL
jgi:ferritin-like protein